MIQFFHVQKNQRKLFHFYVQRTDAVIQFNTCSFFGSSPVLSGKTTQQQPPPRSAPLILGNQAGCDALRNKNDT